MSKGLEALNRIICYVPIPCDFKKADELGEWYDIIEKELKTNKKKLDLISEILVDISKGNYADLNVAIDEIREVLGYE